MAGEIADIKTKTRRLKAKANDIALAILDNPEHELYKETFLTVLKNSVPRSQEISGEDGQPITIIFDSVFNDSDEVTRQTEGDSTIESSVQDSPSG